MRRCGGVGLLALDGKRAAAGMKNFWLRKNILRMVGYVPGEQPRRPGVIKLNANENPYPPSPRVLAAIRREMGRLRLYPESTSREVRERAGRLFRLSADQVMVTNGSDEMLRILFQACVDPGEEVVAFSPSYTYYRTLASIQGARYREIPFTEDYRLPRALPLERARLVFLANPNAPSGTLFAPSEIARLCRATRRGLAVIDEAYMDFAEP
ncbi:MAG: aminotransferase class I/II-fold pyridoxal phosphate-dependent enzyme, partial [Planctomycetota bacterium]|nr:aminotransferase class I/II-fold pyridoxal phosphate-dependent enzyme [Planctomycetota bacterium]